VPDERSLVERFEDEPFVLLGVNTDAPAEDLLERTRARGMTWRSFADGDTAGPITRTWGVTSFPSNVLIDHRGEIHALDLAGRELAEEVQLLVERAKEGF